MGEDGSADLQYVLTAAKEIGRKITHDLIVVNKSTVPVGTADKVKEIINEEIQKEMLIMISALYQIRNF